MKFLGRRLWFCSYHLQEIDTGLSKLDLVQLIFSFHSHINETFHELELFQFHSVLNENL